MDRLRDGDPVRIGTYRLVARLGEGGMGHVYVARSARGRTVAVKLVRRELAEQDEFRDRFRQEVAAARRVGGHWTAPVLDADTEAAVPWIATAYVAGPTLAQVVGHDHGPLPEYSVRILAAGLAHALHDIHAAGIVHRDLKPSNVLVTIDGPRVIDFGIARALETLTEGGLTHAGALVGSPGFMAPEQVRGDRVTPASDVFCLGSVLAYAATGALPFGAAGSGAHSMMFRIAQEEPDLTGVPEALTPLVRDCLHKDPAHRPTPAQIQERTGAPADALADGHERDTWLPGALIAQLGRHALELMEMEMEMGVGMQTDGDGDGGGGGGGDTKVDGETKTTAAGEAEADGPDGPDGADGLDGAVDGKTEAEAGEPDDITPEHAPPVAPPANPAQNHPQHHPQQPFATAPGDSQRPPVWPGDPALEELAVPAEWSATPAVTPLPYTVGRGQRAAARTRRSRQSVALGVAALVVALGAGTSIVAMLNGADGTSPGGAVPSGFLGTWTASVDNSTGHNTRRLTITQGEVGDKVLTLVADGPLANGTYRCVFEATLAERPSSDAPLRINPPQVTTGEPPSSCPPGAASTLTLRKDGTLRRETTGGGGTLTYEKAS